MEGWQEELVQGGLEGYTINEVIGYAKQEHLENLIAVDNTASPRFYSELFAFGENSFDLVSSNKIANTIEFDFYKELRRTLKRNEKNYLYETNVGAGLPLVDTIKLCIIREKT